MKNVYVNIYFAILMVLSSNLLVAQNPDSNISGYELLELSNPENLSAPGNDAPGFPSRAKDLDVLPGFQNPPHGYGEVPFWWWTGDPLDKDRLLWQIEELHKKGVNGMQVNYSHTREKGWPTDKADPELFSKEWWDVWKFVTDECGKRNMGIGLSGYTIDWPKPNMEATNLFSRIIYSIAEINGQTIELDSALRVQSGEMVSILVSDKSIGVWAYPIINGSLSSGGIDLHNFIENSNLNWTSEKGEWEIYLYSTATHLGTINPMHPLAGSTVIDKFFQQFQNNTFNKTSKGLNYFFQDELKFGVGDRIWADDFSDQFQELKGYSVFEILPALYTDMGQVTRKARLDFMDVKVHLSEERYFKPIFDWHWSRGMIYGCDPSSRGLKPEEYGDYFRGTRWYTAPGHDTPGGNADLIKGKVSSSIANLYKRPRVWLEGYHSLGWGATPERLMFATSENYLYGCNLLNLHGLYYTTHGSFWEWAPPSYHFRMPYWDHLDVFLKYFERLSYLLSQGVLQSDIAIMYPVSSIQAEMKSPEEKGAYRRQSVLHNKQGVLSANSEEFTKIAFDSGTELFNNGYDFVFIDHQSLARANIDKGQFTVSDAAYKILVIPSMKSVRWSTIQQALKLYRSGGIVIAVESLPEASDRIGSNDPELDNAIKEMFGSSAIEAKAGADRQRNKAGGIGLFVKNASQLKKEINTLLTKHVSSDKPVRAMHRKIGSRDVYMVMGSGKDVSCHFLSKGQVDKWDPWTGKVTPCFETTETELGTNVSLSFQSNQALIIVFSPDVIPVKVVSTQLDEITNIEMNEGDPLVTGYASIPGLSETTLSINGELIKVSAEVSPAPAPLTLDGDWGFELKPTMDNRWGDFRLPITEKMIGAEARTFSYAEETSNPIGWESPDIDDSKWKEVTYGFGQKFWKIGAFPINADLSILEKELAVTNQIDPTKPVIVNGRIYTWEAYEYSWRMGIEGDPGDQKGYHGLKERVTNDFINFRQPKEGEPAGRNYLWTSAYVQNQTSVKTHTGDLKPSVVYLNSKKMLTISPELTLKAGNNPMLLAYDTPGRTHFVLEKSNAKEMNERTPLSMRWWDMMGRIDFDVKPETNSNYAWYRFTAPPGLQSMTIRAMGKVEVWVDGKPQAVEIIKVDYPASYEVVLSQSILEKSKVAIRVEQARGFTGGSALPEPILLNCVAGLSQAGNWSDGSVLANYSGGAWYRKNISLSEEHTDSRVIIDLGEEVVATAEVKVNGVSAGILVAAPWKLDISKFVKDGDNRIEILVYNTLTNHFKTIPTEYNTNKTQKSGLLGPVKLEFTSKVVLK
ncbi:MAG: hypothetical protein ACI9FN_000087 [Saprospiraceae bacterium]|jgi:hypothetical protein